MWILTVKTSLPEVCWSDDDLKTTTQKFETFENAKSALRKVLKDLAFSENAMFDGEGHLIQMESYAEECEYNENEYPDAAADDSPEWLSSKVLYALREILYKAFDGEDMKIPLNDGEYEDSSIAVQIKDGSICMSGFGCGPINGIDPRIDIDLFDMTVPKAYHLYIDDLFGGLWGQEASAELYIDLINAASEVHDQK